MCLTCLTCLTSPYFAEILENSAGAGEFFSIPQPIEMLVEPQSSQASNPNFHA